MIEEPARQILPQTQGLPAINIVNLLDDPRWSASDLDYLAPVFIPKRSGGLRKIMEPKPYLKAAQKCVVNQIISRKYGASQFAHGFVNKRGRRTNAIPHIGNSKMLKIDIQDFFGACRPKMVISALQRLGPPAWLIDLVERLCFLDDGLPQGSPASPILSNISAREMDYRIAGLCARYMRRPRKNMSREYKNPRKEDIVYTRYADDMTFTSNWDGLNQIVHPVGHILSQCGFAIKPSKTKYFAAPARLESCGVVVSKEKINAKRRDRLYWRGRLHRMIVDIKHNAIEPGKFIDKTGDVRPISEKMFRRIRGKISAIADISPQDKESLFSKFKDLKNLCR